MTALSESREFLKIRLWKRIFPIISYLFLLKRKLSNFSTNLFELVILNSDPSLWQASGCALLFGCFFGPISEAEYHCTNISINQDGKIFIIQSSLTFAFITDVNFPLKSCSIWRPTVLCVVMFTLHTKQTRAQFFPPFWLYIYLLSVFHVIWYIK